MKSATSIILIMTLLLNGCAAMIHGTSQHVSIMTNEHDAKIYANGDFIGVGNSMTTFKKDTKYIITVKKEDCRDYTTIATKSFDATTLLGIFIDFGLISILLVDGAITGAWTKFDRTNYVINMECA